MIRERARRLLLSIIGPAFGACLVGYFVFHAVQGERGLLQLKRLEGEIESSQALLTDLRQVRLQWERQAELLDRDHLDADMLAERGRQVLNVGRPHEYIIYFD